MAGARGFEGPGGRWKRSALPRAYALRVGRSEVAASRSESDSPQREHRSGTRHVQHQPLPPDHRAWRSGAFSVGRRCWQ